MDVFDQGVESPNPGQLESRAPDLIGGRLLVLGSASVSKRGLFEAAKQRGLEVVLAKGDVSWEREYCVDVLALDCSNYENFDRTVDAVSAFAHRHAVDGVVTTSDAAIPVLAQVTKALGTAGPLPETAAVLRDKGLMRRRFAELGLPSACSVRVADHQQAAAAAKEIGYPVVVKPAIGTGSVGVLLASDAGELHRAYDTVARVTEVGNGDGDLLIEEFLDGIEICVDAVTQEGQLCFHNITENPQDLRGPAFEQLEFIIPTRLPEPVVRLAYEVNRETLMGLGLTNSVTHTEMKITSRGPRLIEIHPRVAGQRVPEITRQALGVDLFGAAVDLAMGVPVRIRSQFRCYAGYQCVYPNRAGFLRAIHGIADARQVPGVVDIEIAIQPGSRVGLLPETGQENVAYIYAEGMSFDHVRRQMEDALDMIALDVA